MLTVVRNVAAHGHVGQSLPQTKPIGIRRDQRVVNGRMSRSGNVCESRYGSASPSFRCEQSQHGLERWVGSPWHVGSAM